MLHSMDVAKTHEIMARFRPIAPKPATLPDTTTAVADQPCSAAAAALHLRSRPCRVRKRARATTLLPSKRPRTFLPVLPSSNAPYPLGTTAPPFSGREFPLPGREKPPPGDCADLLSLSLLPAPDPDRGIPVERNLLQKLQEPKVIVPLPVRPVGSSISVACISEDSVSPAPTAKKPEEVEEEVESDTLPAVVSDSNGRVRLANSAYKEMVGQPECPWLDSMVSSSGKLGLKRIGGEVTIDLSGSSVALPVSSNGFSCRVKIEWACNGRKSVINAPCDVIRLSCDSKDYLFTWRFRTSEASATYRVA